MHTLRNSIRLGRIAHAYLFCGPRGVGKTTTARIFAKALNCPSASEGEPCNTCDTCVEIAEGRSIDVLEIDGASNNGVEQVRSIRDSVRFMPARDRYKIYVIDEVHMLTKEAFNALLKTLEEPPPHALFIFATTEPHKLLPTVLSRCQRHDFKRIKTEHIVGQLREICAREGISADETALFIISRKGDGSMRDAESIFDQVVAYAGSKLDAAGVMEVLRLVDEEIFFRVTGLISESDAAGAFNLADEIIALGHDMQDFLTGLEEHLRNLLVVRSTGEARLIEASEESRRRYMTEAVKFPAEDLLRMLKLISDAIQSIRFSPHPRLKFEIALVNLVKMDSTVLISELLSGTGRDEGENRGAEKAAPKTRSIQAKAGGSAVAPASHGAAGSPAAAEKQYSAALKAPARKIPSAPVEIRSSDPPFPTRHEPPPAGPVHPLVRALMDRLGAVMLPDT